MPKSITITNNFTKKTSTGHSKSRPSYFLLKETAYTALNGLITSSSAKIDVLLLMLCIYIFMKEKKKSIAKQ